MVTYAGRVLGKREIEVTRQTQIGDFDFKSGGVDENVPAFHVAVHDVVAMQEVQTRDDLVENAFDLPAGKRLLCASVLDNKARETRVHVLEDQVHFVVFWLIAKISFICHENKRKKSKNTQRHTNTQAPTFVVILQKMQTHHILVIKFL